jgi:hypothetical protein
MLMTPKRSPLADVARDSSVCHIYQPRAITRREGTMTSTYKIAATVFGSFVLGVGAKATAKIRGGPNTIEFRRRAPRFHAIFMCPDR